jgi:hypothetical protein
MKIRDILQEQSVPNAIDIGSEWMTDTELDQYVPDQLQQQWRELVGYDAEGNVSALWANITGGYEPDANDPEDRANMVRVANKWFAMKRIPNVRFFDVRDVGDELEWLVQIGGQGVREGGRRVDNCVKVGEDRLQEFRDDDDGRRDGGGGEDPDFHSRGSWKLDTRHYNQAIDFYSLFGPDEYEDRWVKDPRSGRVVAWEGWRRDLPDTDALGRSIPGKLRKMAGFRWDDVEDTMDDDAPGTGWYYSWSPDWGDIFKQDRE